MAMTPWPGDLRYAHDPGRETIRLQNGVIFCPSGAIPYGIIGTKLPFFVITESNTVEQRKFFTSK